MVRFKVPKKSSMAKNTEIYIPLWYDLKAFPFKPQDNHSPKKYSTPFPVVHLYFTMPFSLNKHSIINYLF